MSMNKISLLISVVSLILLSSCISCSKDDDTNSDTVLINAGNDPNFTIVANTDAGFTYFNRKVTVFGISIYAVAAVEDVKLLHAANIMAQYLDNNEDGVLDNPEVVATMVNRNAFLFMWKNESDMNSISLPDGDNGQDLGNDETIPSWHTNGRMGDFDASLEEVLHLITHVGYANTYPTIFGEQAGTALTNAMDIARGGHFTTIPNPYPINAWYTYDDTTCEYDCMATEYFYWALTSALGAQENRLNAIDQEWKLNTPQLIENTDATIYGLLTNPLYKLPTVLPDGTYKR